MWAELPGIDSSVILMIVYIGLITYSKTQTSFWWGSFVICSMYL